MCFKSNGGNGIKHFVSSGTRGWTFLLRIDKLLSFFWYKGDQIEHLPVIIWWVYMLGFNYTRLV